MRMGGLTKYFCDAFGSLTNIRPEKFFLIHGVNHQSNSNKVYAEVKVFNETVFTAIPSILSAVHSLYSRRREKRFSFYLIIDTTEAATVDIERFVQALHPFFSWIEVVVEFALWVIDENEKFDDFVKEDLVFSHINNSFCSKGNISDFTSLANVSTNLGGRVLPEISKSFFIMIQEVESLLSRTHHMVKVYMQAHQDLKQFDLNYGISLSDPSAIREMMNKLVNRHAVVQSEPDGVILSENGEKVCENLINDYSALNALDSFLYSDVVDRAVQTFNDLKAVMRHTDAAFKRKIRMLQTALRAIEFLDKVTERAEYFEKKAAELDKLRNVKALNVIRLRAQLKKIEELSAVETIKLEDAYCLLDDSQLLLEECCFNDSDRIIIKKKSENMEEILNNFKENLESVRMNLQNALDCRYLIDCMYDWALRNAKKNTDQSNINLMINTYPSNAAQQLLKYYHKCNDSFIRSEIDGILGECDKAIENLKTQQKGLENLKKNYYNGFQPCSSQTFMKSASTTNFSRCRSVNLNHERRSLSPRYPPKEQQVARSLNDISSSFKFFDSSDDSCQSSVSDITQANDENHVLMIKDNLQVDRVSRSVSPSPTQYEIPISKDYISQNGDSLNRKIEAPEEEIRWRRKSWCSALSPPESSRSSKTFLEMSSINETTGHELDYDNNCVGASPVTLDLTDKVILSMSTKTLEKRLDQRKSMGTVPSRFPAPSNVNGWFRPGSARFSLPQKSRAPLLRNHSSDFLDQESISSLNAFRFLDEEYFDPFDENFRPESCASSDNFHFLDLNTQSDEIEMIRMRLTPTLESSANYRIECTVIRDLLDSEIEYVKSLRKVVQDFVPELMQHDVPLALRGKKCCLFGNIEKLFQFHAHLFLPQLLSLLTTRSDDEPLSFAIGKLFVDNSNSFTLYSLYAKNRPKSDKLAKDCADLIAVIYKEVKVLMSLLVKPIERMNKYTLVLQQLLKAADNLEAHRVLNSAVAVISVQIRRGDDLFALESIRGCDLNLKEQGVLLRHDVLFTVEKRGIHSKKRMRDAFLFEKCVVLTKRKLRRAIRGRMFDELKYKASIMMSDCGLTEMVKDSKVKFELWFRKQNSSMTYVLEAQSPSVREAWVGYIRSILWKQAERSREENRREKANMGATTYIHLESNRLYGSLRDYGTHEGRRPRSLISLTASSCSSSNITRLVGAQGELCRVDETDETGDITGEGTLQTDQSTLPRIVAPPLPS